MPGLNYPRMSSSLGNETKGARNSEAGSSVRESVCERGSRIEPVTELVLGFGSSIEDAPARGRFQFGFCFGRAALGQAVVSAWISRLAPSRFTIRFEVVGCASPECSSTRKLGAVFNR